MTETFRIPVMALRDTVIFSGDPIHLFVGRKTSIDALTRATTNGQGLILLAQREGETDTPSIEDLYRVGVQARVLQIIRLPDETVKATLSVHERVFAQDLMDEDDVFTAVAKPLPETERSASETEEHYKASVEILSEPDLLFDDKQGLLRQLSVQPTLAHSVSLLLRKFPADVGFRQSLLEVDDVTERMQRVRVFLESRKLEIQIQKDVGAGVRAQMETQQRRHLLTEQMKVIRKELDQESEELSEIDMLAERIEKKNLPKDARKRVESEFKRLRNTPPMSQETSVLRNYIEWILDLPWEEGATHNLDILKAEAVLDKGHFGLEKVKERILEHIVVQSRSDTVRGPVLCLIGPPGVGKTSLGKSMAEAMGREFIRIPLGGVRDESEIRGHRRTYLGAMPGKIISALRRCGTSNPVIMLDEIDKIIQDGRGDPAAALLEVLDPEQNSAFMDHYLDLGYDLSKVVFLTTANEYRMSRPLADRMEIIELSGYTEEEKVRIAREHLIPKQLVENAVKPDEVVITDDAVLMIVRHFTRESGVRNLEREIGALLRKAITEVEKSETSSIRIDAAKAETYLGVRRFEFGVSEERDHVGMVNGLAWSQVGGNILNLEAVKMSGKGKVRGTGSLGDVMKESIETATSFLRGSADGLGIPGHVFESFDVHVHAPAGATPKDGPSAGLAMTTVILSALTGIPVRKDVAMTGEVTLRGSALIIGGLKEKLLAALRGGMKTVIIPHGNVKDLAEMPKSVLDGLEIIPVRNVREVFPIALTRPIAAADWPPVEVAPDRFEARH